MESVSHSYTMNFTTNVSMEILTTLLHCFMKEGRVSVYQTHAQLPEYLPLKWSEASDDA